MKTKHIGVIHGIITSELEAEDLVSELADWLSWGIAESCTSLLHRTDHR